MLLQRVGTTVTTEAAASLKLSLICAHQYPVFFDLLLRLVLPCLLGPLLLHLTLLRLALHLREDRRVYITNISSLRPLSAPLASSAPTCICLSYASRSALRSTCGSVRVLLSLLMMSLFLRSTNSFFTSLALWKPICERRRDGACMGGSDSGSSSK